MCTVVATHPRVTLCLLDDFIKEYVSEKKKALPKEIGSLEIAIENDYVDKFYTGCK